MLELYTNIKKYRTELGITQQELAIKAGYKDKSMIAKIEKGLVDLPQSKITLFASILGVTESELMGWNEPTVDYTISQPPLSFVAESKSIYETSAESRIMAYAKISPLFREIALRIMDMPTEQQELVANMVGVNRSEMKIVPISANNSPKKWDVNAAHTRTDVTPSSEDILHDEDIMDDDNF